MSRGPSACPVRKKLARTRSLWFAEPVVFGQKPRLQWKLEADPAASPEGRAHLDAWLRSSAFGTEGLLLNEAALEESRW